MIKAIIFDIDNTLYDYDDANAKAYVELEKYTLEQFGWNKEITEKKIKAAYSRIQNEIGKKAATHNRLIRFQRILETEGIPLHPYALDMYSIYWDTLIDNAEVFSGVHDALRQLKSAGYTLGIGTNMTSVIQFRKLTEFKLLDFFDFIVSSEEADCEKPENEFFIRCAIKAGYDPSLCLFVGDSLMHDIIPAQDAGMQALWFRPSKLPLPSDAAVPVDHLEYSDENCCQRTSFSDFSQLPCIIDQLQSHLSD